MLNIIYSEFIKLKRTYMIPIIFVGSVFIPIVLLIVQMDKNNNISVVMNIMPNINIFQTQIVDMFRISLLASYTFSREFTDKTADTIYSYPFSRMKIFIGKIVTIYSLIIVLYVLNFLIINILVYFLTGLEGIKAIIALQLKVSVLSLIGQIIILPIPIFIGCISKNVIFSVVYGTLGALSTMFVSIFGVYMQLWPLMIPSIPNFYFYAKDPIDTIALIINIIAVFIIFLSLSIFYFTRKDIS